MTVVYTAAIKADRLALLITDIGPGALLRVYGDARPADPSVAITTQRLLTEHVCGSPFGTVTGTTVTANPILGATVFGGIANVVPTFYRLFKADGVTVVADGSVGTANADLIVQFATLSTGDSLDIQSFIINAGINTGGSSSPVLPNAPTNLTAGTATSTTQPLSWTASTVGDTPITYKVETKLTSGSTWVQVAIGLTGTSTTVSSLAPSTPYDYRVTPQNIAGDGPAATITNVSTAGVSSPGSVQLSASTYNVGEGAGTVTISVTRVGGSTGAASVHYATANGTATAGSDYTSAAGTLNWADADAATKTFTVPITDDVTVESAETFTVTLSAVTGASLGSPSVATVTINDNDVASDTKPRVGVGAALASLASLFAAATDAPGGINGSRAVSSFTTTPAAGQYGYVFILQSACVTGGSVPGGFYGATFTETLGPGGWQGADDGTGSRRPSNNTGASPSVSYSSILYTDTSGVYVVFRQDFANSTFTGSIS